MIWELDFSGKCRDRSPGRWENNKSTPYRENPTKTDLPCGVKKNTLSIAANALKQFINNYIETKLKDKA